MRNVQIIDSGHRWNDRPPGRWSLARLFDESKEIFYYKWPSFITANWGVCSRGTLLPAGEHEWPFELWINGSAAESIDGLSNSHISYGLKATITRGLLGSALRTHRQVRVIRAMNPAAVDLAGPVREEGVWSNKIEYQFCILQRSIMFGTVLTLQMSISTLIKGLKMRMVTCGLIESQEFRMRGTTPGTSFIRRRTIAQWQFGINGREEYSSEERLPLPKRFSMCVQDTDVCGIKVCHEIQISLDVGNPDSHTSEVRLNYAIDDATAS